MTGANGTQRSPAGAAIAPNSWHHFAMVAGGGKITLFLDGEQYAALNGTVPALNAPASLGGDASGRAGFNGELDELELSKIARPAGLSNWRP